MNYPTVEEVEKADRYQICKWYRFLECPMPGEPEQQHIMNLIYKRFKELGGFTPEISKSIGW